MSKRELTLRYLVDVRAAGRCEYCRRYKRLIGETFLEVEHILPRSRGGLTTTAIKLRKNRCIVGAVFNRTWVV